MGVANANLGSGRVPPASRICNGPRNGRQVAPAMQKKPAIKASLPLSTHSGSNVVPKAPSTGSARLLKPLAPNLNGSRDVQNGMRPPPSKLAATHLAKYSTSHSTPRKVAFQPYPLSRGSANNAHFKTGLLTPSPLRARGSMGPLPSTPLFSTVHIKDEPEYLPTPKCSPLLNNVSSTAVAYDDGEEGGEAELHSRHWQIAADPMRQTSMTPPDWQGKISVLRADSDAGNGNIVSPVAMTGLPFGGMLEVADHYGPSPSTGHR